MKIDGEVNCFPINMGEKLDDEGGGAEGDEESLESGMTVVLIPNGAGPESDDRLYKAHLPKAIYPKPTTSPILGHENLKTKSLFVKRYLKYNPFLTYLLPITCILVILVIVYVFKDFPRKALQWIESQEANSWMLFLLFMFLFIVVSFPVTVGYLVIIITSGYLFGFIKGGTFKRHFKEIKFYFIQFDLILKLCFVIN